MWNLSDVAECYSFKTVEGGKVYVLKLDYNKIPEFLNQEDFDLNEVTEHDNLCVRELYHYGSQGVTYLQSDGTLLITFNDNYKSYNDWVLDHEVGHCITGYQFILNKWYKVDIGDKDKRECLADNYMINACWDENFISEFVKDAKRYFDNLYNIFLRPVNQENLIKFFDDNENPFEYLEWDYEKLSRGIYEKILTNTYNASRDSTFLKDDNIRKAIQKEIGRIIERF